jgi:hypothetical protein
MNATTARGATAEQYLDRVRAALTDLPVDEREELLEDLPAHLADVAAESDGALEERLGSPEEYAAELRASAGLAPPAVAGAGKGVRGTRRLAEFSAAMEQWPAWQRFRAFAPSLRPGWWVLRGYLVALAIAAGTTDMDHNGVSVDPDADLFLFLPFAALVIYASVWLGRLSSGWRGARRAAMYALNGLVVVVALALATVASSPRVDEVTYSPDAAPLSWVEDVYVYDRNGQPLHDVRLYDQFGNPIQLPGQPLVRERADGSGVETNVYPRGAYGTAAPGYPPNDAPPANVPPLLPRPPVAASPSPGQSQEPSPQPTTSPTVSPSPSPTR